MPFGTQVIINGHTYTVQDRGGSIQGKRLDLYFENHQDAKIWGRRTLEVTIIKQ